LILLAGLQVQRLRGGAARHVWLQLFWGREVLPGKHPLLGRRESARECFEGQIPNGLFGGSFFLLLTAAMVVAQGDPLGCLGDLGWYCVRFGLFAFGWDVKPLAVSAKKVR
jgi:hypothetical protein